MHKHALHVEEKAETLSSLERSVARTWELYPMLFLKEALPPLNWISKDFCFLKRSN